MKQPLNALIVKEGEGVQDAVALGDGIFMSKGISNSYLVTTSDGDVLVNSRDVPRGGGDQAAVRRREQQPAAA